MTITELAQKLISTNMQDNIYIKKYYTDTKRVLIEIGIDIYSLPYEKFFFLLEQLTYEKKQYIYLTTHIDFAIENLDKHLIQIDN